jgi:glutaconate CoA-transferase subunit B
MSSGTSCRGRRLELVNAFSEELLIGTLARLLEGAGHVAVGALSPIPGAAALLARALSGDAMRVTVLGSRRYNGFTDGGRELFDCAAQGRIDAFFLGGGQIDGEANVNLVGTGGYPNSETRFPGSFGAPYMYFLVPRVILFREEHSPRVLVPKVDFISAPGVSGKNVYRRGGPVALLTGKALFAFDRERRRFRLESVHPGNGVDDIVAGTGFEFERPEEIPVTPAPTPEMLALIRGTVGAQVAETYPRFAADVLGESPAAAPI